MASLTSDPYLTPAMKAPPGLHSNLIDPPSTGYSTIIICILVIVLSTPFVVLRCCVLGWMFEIALTGLLFKAINYGGGTDLWNVSKSKYMHFTKLFHDIEIIARIGMFFTKASIVLLYQRLFLPPGTGRSHIWWSLNGEYNADFEPYSSIWFVFYWNLLYALALVLTVATECVGKADKVARGDQCLDEYAVLICASVINVVSDLMILVIPIAAIWGLHMAKEKKLRLSAVFAVGSLGVLASVARLGYQIPEAKKPNQTIIVMILTELNIVEHMVGLIVSSMPSLPAFVRHLHGAAPSTSTWFEPLSQRENKRSSERSVLWFKRSPNPDRGRGGAGMGLDDPSLLYSANSGHGDAGYEELTDLEGQKGTQTKREGLEEFMENVATTTVGVENRGG
ncbi:hypothetical protein HO133_006209 [Letharia lupina]|uniref:Rhodopsin domain-containing protein n=1 Tax=Letharia lupina TaxID=560253 RepID=A0A8H6C7C4_9LECA|nr:uncharacterized protein HO133_006209 [Letharia lupina]KAF6218247.1 hypothetical protein HO133_006209 [Letharia lupina]